jgi:dolichyl-phosphate-mannose-protein mannosyltransferase
MIDDPLDYSEIRRFRLLPSLAGALIAPVIFLALLTLRVSRIWCFTIAFLVGFDQAILTETRFVLLEPFLLLFASITILMSAVVARRPNSPLLSIIVGGMASGMAFSTKFTGGGVGIAFVLSIFMSFPLTSALLYSFVAAFAGFSVFATSLALHLLMLRLPGPGCKVSPEWCDRVQSGDLQLFDSILKLVKRLCFKSLEGTEPHSNSSKWWQWPLMLGKAVSLWSRGNKGIYCIGSPVVWLGAALGVLVWLVMVFRSRKVRATLWIGFGYCVSWFPFALVTRETWNYHYFIPLLYALVAAGVAMDAVARANTFLPPVLVVLELICYGFWLPLTYGVVMTKQQFEGMMLKIWI